jgi:ribulose-phosphate 3-epimerase
MKYILAPSILASDFGNLQREITMLNESLADWIHVDVMDGVFVPNISMGFPVMNAIKKHASKPIDVHLMIVNPEKYVEAFRKAGADSISVHIEACPHLHRNIQQIQALGAKAGIAINPHTPVIDLENVIEYADLVCLMSVNPGFGAQKFIPNTYQKITDLKNLIKAKNSRALIEIDGGVNEQNAAQLLECGAGVLVAGNLIFSDPKPKELIQRLKRL